MRWCMVQNKTLTQRFSSMLATHHAQVDLGGVLVLQEGLSDAQDGICAPSQTGLHMSGARGVHATALV